ncbi:hypothetical protein J6590_001847 [Homalodisca vitripennis]|nr:hypothetical protein J6590_001847 [Homalodisca vitripennis]
MTDKRLAAARCGGTGPRWQVNQSDGLQRPPALPTQPRHYLPLTRSRDRSFVVISGGSLHTLQMEEKCNTPKPREANNGNGKYPSLPPAMSTCST